MSVAVITDSTAYLPPELAERYVRYVAPLHVCIDGVETLDETDFGPKELTTALGRKQRVTTSGATPHELAIAYREALDAGAEAVVSVHLSRVLSATWDAARSAAAEVDPERTHVVDSRSAGMGLGFAVLSAASTAQSGADAPAVVEAAVSAAQRTTTMFSVATLDYLRRGGRVSTTAALLGTALAIKPILHLRDGRIEALEKQRTMARANTRLLELAVEAASYEPASVAVHHLAAPERAEQLAEALGQRIPHLRECIVSEVGAVIGAHLGPGAVGIAVLPGGRHSFP